MSKRKGRPKRHKDVEFAVDDASGNERIFKTFDEAAGFAVSIAASGRDNAAVNVLIHSVAGARWWGGDDAVEEYKSDPDASVSEQIVVKAESIGRIA
jgi:hypothetical protein